MVLSRFLTIFLLGFKLTSLWSLWSWIFMILYVQKFLVRCLSHDLWFATSCKDHAHAIGRCKTITIYIQGLDIALHRHSKILVLTVWWCFPEQWVMQWISVSAVTYWEQKFYLPKTPNEKQTQTNRRTNKPQHWRLHLRSPPQNVSLLFSSTQKYDTRQTWENTQGEGASVDSLL